jgi:serine acetyltransferase
MIGANAVVIDDIPESSVAVGIPAKVVRKVSVPFTVALESIRDVPESVPQLQH